MNFKLALSVNVFAYYYTGCLQFFGRFKAENFLLHMSKSEYVILIFSHLYTSTKIKGFID